MNHAPRPARITASQWVIAVVLLAAVGAYFGYLTLHSGTPGEREGVTETADSTDLTELELQLEPIAIFDESARAAFELAGGPEGESASLTDSDSPRGEFNPRTVLGRAIRPIVNAPHIKADQVKKQVKDNDLVLGVVVNGAARAYPINLLCGPSREIINDELGGTAIAATW